MDIILEMISAGIIGGVLILAVKSGVGCGLSNLSGKELMMFASMYAVIALIMGAGIGYIPFDLTEQVVGLGLLMHTAIGVGLIYFGIQTGRRWHCEKCDISRHTFLWLSLPCPACLAATFFSCMILIETTGYPGFTIGGIVGSFFAGGVIIGAVVVKSITNRYQLDRTTILGSVMLFLGLFYLVTPLIVFAYMKMESVPNIDSTVNIIGTITAMAMMTGIVLLGILIERTRQMRKAGGQ